MSPIFLSLALMGQLSTGPDFDGQAAQLAQPKLSMEAAESRFWVYWQGKPIEVLGQRRSDGKIVTVFSTGKLHALDPAPKPTPPAATVRPETHRPMPADADPRPSGAFHGGTPEPTNETAIVGAAWMTNGVQSSLVQAGLPKGTKERFHSFGATAKAFQADVEAIEKGTIQADQVDDSRKPYFTVIGPDADRKAVLADLKPDGPLAWIREKFHIQEYAPDDWAVKGVGLPSGGKPTILIQAAPDKSGKGKVLWHQEDYAGGAAALIEACRKVNPDYRPDKDPGPSQPIKTTSHDNLAWMGCGAVVLLLIYFATRQGPGVIDGNA